MKYVILVAYDGFDYHGWQYQPQRKTIAGTLKQVFESTFNVPVRLVGASRTDAGVHALGQVVLVDATTAMDPQVVMEIWNRRLPRDIHIRSCIKAPDDFFPFKAVLQKTYYYHFFTRRPLPFYARYGLKCMRPVNIDRLQEGLSLFVGTHDFRSFCTGLEQKDTVRTIDAIKVIFVPQYQAYRIVVQGKSFLHHMIRRIVGACLYTAMYPNRTCQQLIDALYACNPHQQLPNAHPHGLLLRRIVYQDLRWNI